jgi:hypothetical protein
MIQASEIVVQNCWSRGKIAFSRDNLFCFQRFKVDFGARLTAWQGNFDAEMTPNSMAYVNLIGTSMRGRK